MTVSKKKPDFLRRNGLSLVLLAMMLTSLCAQCLTGLHEYNSERAENGLSSLGLGSYLSTGHFISTTFENWESEFLQMAMYVLLTIWLRQQGSSESKQLEGKEAVDREPKPHAKAPWPVNKGGIWLKLYSNSLSIAFALLFGLSFVLHFVGSLKSENEERLLAHKPLTDALSYLGTSRFWFESFQNWQSEFLAVLAIVWLSIWLRQKGSPESKPVDAPYDETGE